MRNDKLHGLCSVSSYPLHTITSILSAFCQKPVTIDTHECLCPCQSFFTIHAGNIMTFYWIAAWKWQYMPHIMRIYIWYSIYSKQTLDFNKVHWASQASDWFLTLSTYFFWTKVWICSAGFPRLGCLSFSITPTFSSWIRRSSAAQNNANGA